MLSRREFMSIAAKVAALAYVPSVALAEYKPPALELRITELAPASDCQEFMVQCEEAGNLFVERIRITHGKRERYDEAAFRIAQATRKIQRDVARFLPGQWYDLEVRIYSPAAHAARGGDHTTVAAK